jgi:hypothetical protein
MPNLLLPLALSNSSPPSSLSLPPLRPSSLPSLLWLRLQRRTRIMGGILGVVIVIRERRKRKKKITMGKFFITISSWIMHVTGCRTDS